MVRVLLTISSIVVLAFSQIMPASAQGVGLLYGRITDAGNNHPLEGASIFVRGTHIGTATDLDGWYVIRNLKPGTYTLTISFVGYRTLDNVSLEIAGGDTLQHSFALERTVLRTDEVTITATRGSSLITEVPASVDVLNTEMIERDNPPNLAEVLDNVQGVYVRDYGGLGGMKTISLRGSNSEQVLVLLDGQRLNNPQNGQVDFSSISTEGIERIEVVRGGNSALYGADAIGGVINIITKKRVGAPGIHLSAKGTIGSFNSRSAETAVKFNYHRTLANVSFRRLTSSGDFPYTGRYGKDATRENNHVSTFDLFARLRTEIGDPHRPGSIDFSYKYYLNRKGSPGNTEMPFKEAWLSDETHHFNSIFDLPLKQMTDQVKVQMYAHAGVNRYHNLELLVPADDTHEFKSLGGETQLNTVLSPMFALISGAGGRYDLLNSTAFTGAKNRTSAFAFIEDESVFHPASILSSFSIVPAIRLDHFTDFGTHVSPKIGAVLTVGDEWSASLKANTGLSFRAPTFNDLYWPFDGLTEGNQNLTPEHGTDWDVGLRLRYPILNGYSFDITYFQSRISDMIVWQMAEDGIWRPYNEDKAAIQGVEVSSSIEPILDMCSLSGNYSYLFAENLSDDASRYGMILPYRPKNTLNLSATFSWYDIELSYQYSYVGLRYTNFANTQKVPSYTTSDVTLNTSFNWMHSKWTETIQVRNLLDERYEIIRYQPVPGREIRVTLGVSTNIARRQKGIL
ncbi:MAG: TonB-dependent receptor [bacterium]